MKQRLKSYGFWVSVASAVMVFLQTLGAKFDLPYMNEVVTAFLGVLVVAGIINKPGGGVTQTTGTSESAEKTDVEVGAEDAENDLTQNNGDKSILVK